MDTGIIVIAHFENPAQRSAVNFLSEILGMKVRCVIPTSAFLGAYHIMTRYIGVEAVAAFRALSKTLETRSPTLFTDIPIDLAIDALAYAGGYRVESWDGYIMALARAFNAPIIYSIDKGLSRKVKGINVVNPIPEEEFRAYCTWLRGKLVKREG
ncbi:TPA: PIN domain-containing protein [Candidatus Bathyarchaeota archaeon]|nr:PIN domain-containing protein [Candidatus Bathyarchaeota archaeon]